MGVVERDVIRQKCLTNSKALIDKCLSRLELRHQLWYDHMFLDYGSQALIIDVLQ